MTDRKLTMDDKGGTVRLSIGDRAVLSLPENPTTGVRWILPESDAIECVEDSNIPGGPGIGAAGTRVLTLQPTRPGRTSLKLLRRQAWEPEDTADASFEVELEVE